METAPAGVPATANERADDPFIEGNAYFARQAYGPAIFYYRQAIEQQGPKDIYYQNLALALWYEGRLIECQRLLREGLAHNPASQPLFELLRALNAHELERHQGPALSVIVPVYNSGQYLESCLRSILHQTFRDFELIVINDGSTDESGEIIERLALEDERIRVIRHASPSGNPGTPRNRALDISRGAFIGFVDSDDWIDPGFYDALMARASEARADIVFSGGFVNHAASDTSMRRYNNDGFDNPDSPRYKYHDSFMIWDKVFNASLIRAFDIRLAETRAAVDVPFVFRAYYWAFAIDYCDELVGYHYRRESESSVTVNYRKSSDCQFEVAAYEHIWSWARANDVPEYYRDVIRFKQINSYTYTLSVIAPEYFEDFYSLCRKAFRAIPRETVLRFSHHLKKNHLVQKYDTVLHHSAAHYAARFRDDQVAFAVQTIKPSGWDDECTFHIQGNKPGVLVFPDWSRSNPYQKLLYGALAQQYDIRIKGFRSRSFTKAVLEKNRSQYSCIHLHWLHSMLDASNKEQAEAFLDTLDHARSLGYRILYTAHNIVSHDAENEQAERFYRRRAAAKFDHVLAHGHYAKDRVVEELLVPAEKIAIVPHGTYEGFYPNHVSRSAARRFLSLSDDDVVFLFFGNIKGYKGVDVLLEVFSKLRRMHSRAKLVVAGRVFGHEAAEMIHQCARANEGIVFHPGFVKDEQAQYYLNAADIMVLPYRRILTSGAALLSLSYRLPVIAPRTGLLPELIEEGKQGFLFDDYAQMADQMSALLEERASFEYEFDDLNRRLRWTEVVQAAPFNALFGVPDRQKDVAEKPYEYALVRIVDSELLLADDFEARCRAIAFILESEEAFDRCAKLWLLYGLPEGDRKRELVSVLRAGGAEYQDVAIDEASLSDQPFGLDELPEPDLLLSPDYSALPRNIKDSVEAALLVHKQSRLLGGAEAANRAFEWGAQQARWVLPLSACDFMSEQGWLALVSSLARRNDLLYHLVSPVPVSGLGRVQDVDFQPETAGEPRLVLRHDVSLRFGSELGAEGSPVAHLLSKLGVSGYWAQPIARYPWQRMLEQVVKGGFCYAWSGWLAEFEPLAQAPERERQLARLRARTASIRRADRDSAFADFDKSRLTVYDLSAFDHQGVRDALKHHADRALSRPVRTVVDKTSLPPSLDRHDYWCPSPLEWPDTSTLTGLPYVSRPGERVPGTEIYDPVTEDYDRASLQCLFETSTTLGLSGVWLGNRDYLDRAVQWVRAWFIDSDTAMNPHLLYSRVSTGHYGGFGVPEGINEARDFYYFLDVVRLLKGTEGWLESDSEAMDRWLAVYLDWLLNSDQGRELSVRKNDQGTAYELQVYAIAAFLGDVDVMYDRVPRIASRLRHYVSSARVTVADADGAVELDRQLWIALARLLGATSRFDLTRPGQWWAPGESPRYWQALERLFERPSPADESTGIEGNAELGRAPFESASAKLQVQESH